MILLSFYRYVKYNKYDSQIIQASIKEIEKIIQNNSLDIKLVS